MVRQFISVQDLMVRVLEERVSSNGCFYFFLGTILSLSYDEQHRSLTENWLRHWATPHTDLEKTHPSLDEPISPINIAEKIETSNTYVPGSIGYEFIIPTARRRHVFAVLQRPQEHVRIHQLNLQDGHLINELILNKAKPSQTFLCGTTETLCDSHSGKEFFAIGLQSGMIFIFDTNPLQVHSVVNGRYSHRFESLVSFFFSFD